MVNNHKTMNSLLFPFLLSLVLTGYAQSSEELSVDDLINDVKRVEYIESYLNSLTTAIR